MGKVKLLLQGIVLLAPPTLLVVWLITGFGVRAIARWSTDFRDSVFSANTIVMMLIWLGHVMILINLLFYIAHVSSDVRRTKAKHVPGRSHLRCVIGLSGFIAMAIATFVVVTLLAFSGIQIPGVSCESTIAFNHYLLLAIFVCFVVMDFLALRSARLQGTKGEGDAMASLLSIWLVSVPSIFITCFALVLHWILVTNPDWMLIYDKPEILSGEQFGYLHVPLVSPSAAERPMFGLFVSGLNVGVLMASIIASQIAFFVLTVFRQRPS